MMHRVHAMEMHAESACVRVHQHALTQSSAEEWERF